MTGARTAVALYVAVALHAVALLFLLLAPLPQTGTGEGIGLSLAGGGAVLAAPGVPSVRPAAKAEAAPRPEVSPVAPAVSTTMAMAKRSPTTTPTAPSAPEPPSVAMPASAPTTDAATIGSTSATPRGDAGPGEGFADAGGGGVDTYFARLRTHLAAFRREVPDAASGRAEVRFTVLPDGRVAGLMLERSSGSERLDAEALALVARAMPLPPPPRGEPLRVRVPIYVGG